MDHPPEPQQTLSLKSETSVFFVIMILAGFMRIYRLGEFPAGIFPDQGNEAWNALKILRNGWPSFTELLRLPVCVASVYPYLAFWFKLFPATQISLFLASVWMALLAFPALYWVFRQWAGAPTALLALFFLAVMRWHVTYSRDAHPAIEVSFYMGATLGFWLYGLRVRKNWPFIVGGIFLAGGSYSYQDLKVLPVLILIFAIYEWVKSVRPGERRDYLVRTALFFFVFIILTIPLWWNMIQERSLGWREDELMAFPGLFYRSGWKGVLGQFLGTALAFNRTGDSWFYHNIPGHRLLDDTIGIFFILGLFKAFLGIRERANFYSVAGFLMMCLPAFLSVNPNHASRLFGTIPFIVFLSADIFRVIFRILAKEKNLLKILLIPGAALTLGFCGIQNFTDYFLIQARNDACWRVDNGAETSWIGKAIAEDPHEASYLICPRFFGNYDIRFLAFNHQDQVFPLKMPQSINLAGLPRGKDLCLAMDEGHTGLLDLFESLYPKGLLKTLSTPQGIPVAYLYRIPADHLPPKTGLGVLPSDFGLKGTYRVKNPEGGDYALAQIDPVLNFTFRNDFPVTHFPPLFVQWKGWVKIDLSGNYRFLILTTDQGNLTIAGNKILTLGNEESKNVFLKKGLHWINVSFEKVSGTDAAFTLAWKKPGDSQYKSVPARSLRHL